MITGADLDYGVILLSPRTMATMGFRREVLALLEGEGWQLELPEVEAEGTEKMRKDSHPLESNSDQPFRQKV